MGDRQIQKAHRQPAERRSQAPDSVKDRVPKKSGKGVTEEDISVDLGTE